MLVVKAEIWPRGEADERFEIARIGIANRSNNVRGVADYNIVGLLGRDKQEWVTQGMLLGHVRSLGWQPLVARALTEQEDGLLHSDYVDSVAELLRKG